MLALPFNAMTTTYPLRLLVAIAKRTQLKGLFPPKSDNHGIVCRLHQIKH